MTILSLMPENGVIFSDGIESDLVGEDVIRLTYVPA
jgi:hypothetical protein